MTNNKETAKADHCKLIRNSWTYNRLTPEEAAAWNNFIYPLDIKGTAKQRHEQIAQLYHAFLLGCGYTPIGWREPEPNNVPF